MLKAFNDVNSQHYCGMLNPCIVHVYMNELHSYEHGIYGFQNLKVCRMTNF